MITAITAQRVFAQQPDMALRLGAAGYSRPMQVGGNWVRIRLGMLCSLDSGVTIPSTVLYLGLCSSWGPPIAEYSVGRFIGASLSGSAVGGGSGGWTYVAGTLPHLKSAANVNVFTKFQTTLLQAVAGSALAFIAQTYPISKPRRTPIYVDITRNDGGCGLCTVTVYGCSVTTVDVDYRPDHFWAGLDAIGTPVVNGQTMTSLATSAALTMGDELGACDTFGVYHSRSANCLLDIYALGASVIWTKPIAYQVQAISGAYESFDGAAVGVPVTAQGYAGTFAAGWSSAGTSIGNPTLGVVPPGTAVSSGVVQGGAYYGTVLGPFDSFDSAANGSITSGVLAGGVGWAGSGTAVVLYTDAGSVSGTALYNPGLPSATQGTATYPYYGTTAAWPFEDFESYDAGTIYQDFSLTNTGLYWAGAGTVLAL